MLIREQLAHIVIHLGGSQETVRSRKIIMRKFINNLQRNHIFLKGTKKMTSWHIQSHVRTELQRGVSKLTIRNEMKVICIVLRKAGKRRVLQSDLLSDEALGIAKVKRNKN